MTRIYGELNNIKDLRKISRKIRNNVRKARTQAALTELHRRQLYLCTLTFSPNFRSKFKRKIGPLRNAAKREYTKTSLLINRKAKSLGLKVKYDKYWGKKG